MNCFLFDIDGTLTSPRQKIDPLFEEWFFNWTKTNKTFLVTGSDIKKVEEQLSQRIIDNCHGIFCSMANEFYIKNEIVYKNELNIPESLVSYLQDRLTSSVYPNKKTNNFEYRTGMLNYSIAGRDSSNQERCEYYTWDSQSGERQNIVEYINKNYGHLLEASIGGQISIDISNTGNNKSLASKWIRQNLKEYMYFFGDKTFEGGNDHALAMDIVKHNDGVYFQIDNIEDLKKILKTWSING
jgi:phosphomannomutase